MPPQGVIGTHPPVWESSQCEVHLGDVSWVPSDKESEDVSLRLASPVANWAFDFPESWFSHL